MFLKKTHVSKLVAEAAEAPWHWTPRPRSSDSSATPLGQGRAVARAASAGDPSPPLFDPVSVLALLGLRACLYLTSSFF